MTKPLTRMPIAFAFLLGVGGPYAGFAQGVPRSIAPCTQGDSGQTVPGPGGGTVGVNFPNSLNCGVGSLAGAEGATAIGDGAQALGVDSTAVGRDSQATGPNASAFGARSVATGANSTALGADARATHAGATAVGAGAVTTADNQVVLGAPGTSVRIGDIGASTAAQSGPVGILTVDGSGTVGRDTTLLPSFSALQSDVGTLFDLREIDRRDARQGIAAAIAIGDAPFPSAPGRTSYVLNVATFRGEQAIGGSLMHRLRAGTPLAVSVGFSYAGNRNNGARVGVAGEF